MDPDTFFSLFERVAETSGRSGSERTLQLQGTSILLTVTDSKVHARVKKRVLKPYKLMPEAYRQKFCFWGKLGSQTYQEFGRGPTTHFHR